MVIQMSNQTSALDPFNGNIINQPIANLGAIYFISIQDKLIIIEGWLASFKQGQVDQFRLLINHQEITDFDLTLGLPSPDVQESYPYLDHAETARFRMQLSWQEDPEQLHNCLIILTPLFQGKEGQVLLTAFNPTLPIPSEECINHIGGYGEWWFKQLAFQFLGYFIQRAGLKPTDSVLDVGCGVGRIAYGLTSYLKPPGRYEGFDVMESLIKWPKQEITSRFPHFNFYRVDLHNLMYNPTGIIKSIDFVFPYADESFDFVFLTSVFTHLPPPEVRHYLSEIYRVMKPGGRCLCTCFILNEESEKLIDEGKSSQAIIYELEECFTKDLNVPEEAIGYKEHLLLKWIENYGFSVVDISYGGWCGRTEFSSGQDFLILQKGNSPNVDNPSPENIQFLENEELEDQETNIISVPQQQSSSLLAIETIPSEISHSQSLLKTIKANLERSLLQNQQVQQDLERSQREVQQRQYQRNLKTIFKTLKKQFPDHLNPVRDEYLLGLSGVTCEQFWKIIDPIIETQRPYLSHTSPTISILTPTWNSSLDWFLETVLSVLMQSRFDWEWCLVDDGSQQPEIRAILQGLAEKHPHIQVTFQESGGISSATNRALKMATGDYVCFLDHDDTLIPTALQDSLNQLAKGFDVVYSDEDKIDFSGLNYLEPFYKPDWSPEYFRGVMYAGHLLSVRRKLALEVGGLNSEFDGVQDYEFLLRLSEVTQNIGHLPKILYHWRKVRGSISGDVDAKAGIDTLQQAAVNSHLQRLGLLAQAEAGLGRHRVNINPHPKTDYPLISLIVATSKDSLEKSLHNFVAHSSYPNWEMIWVEPESSYPELQQNLQEFPVKKIAVSDPFKRSKAYNLGAKQAKGEYLVFLNPNTEAITEDWLRHLLYYAEQSDVGAVGGLLLSPERTVEQAGFILGKAGEIHTFMPDFQPNADGYAGSLICAREVAAVSCDCMMVKASTFDKIGGFNEYFFHQNYDSDFCLKIRQNHQRIIFTPRAVLINHQPMTGNDPTDKMLFLDQWHIDLESGDPYYNCNFNPDNFDYTILG